MDRQTQFLMLVQTAAIERALKMGDATHDLAAAAMYRAMQIAPRRLPKDLNQATFEVIEWLMCGGVRPAWVKLDSRLRGNDGGRVDGPDGTDRTDSA